jgi:glycosyltransferase involved in cell wall biosynthesis
MTVVSELATVSKVPMEGKSKLRNRLLKTRLREYALNDSLVCRFLAAVLGLIVGWALYGFGRTRRGFEILAKIHSANWFRWSGASASWLTRRAVRTKPNHRLMKVFRDHLEDRTPLPVISFVFQDPPRMFLSWVVVIKSPKENEKGVLVIAYNHAILAFARLFDIEEIARRYHIVMEPSWCGYCTLDIVAYTRFDFPVFVQASEPRDAGFLESLKSNLIPVPIGANWWVDHRLIQPIPGTRKDVDIVMAAAWGDYKRHFRFFAALRKLRRAGHTPSVLLLGYGGDQLRENILDQARYYGIDDQLEVHEKVPYVQMNEFFNRAKVSILWSRKEGFNRAFIEGMFAGLPSIMRAGFNFGHHYDYMNKQTGCFSSEHDLPAKLLWMVENHDKFAARQWAMENMSCQKATEILEKNIRARALQDGENWTEGLAVKTNKMNSMEYWNPENFQKFAHDYDFLRSAIR